MQDKKKPAWNINAVLKKDDVNLKREKSSLRQKLTQQT